MTRRSLLVIVIGFIVIIFGVFLWVKIDENKWIKNRNVAAPAHQLASQMTGQCEAKDWYVMNIIDSPTPGVPAGTKLFALRCFATNENINLDVTPSNEYHQFPTEIKVADMISIEWGPYVFGQIFSPYACDYLKITKKV